MFKIDGGSDLSFVRIIAGVADFWAIEPSGVYSADCQRGREAALELDRHMCFRQCPNMLGSVARSIGAKKRWTGLEVGFFQQIAEGMSAGAGLSS